MSFGSDVETATTRAMATLNKALTAKSKAAIRQRQPLKKKAPPAGGGKRKVTPRARPTPGNTKGFFDQMAEDHLNK